MTDKFTLRELEILRLRKDGIKYKDICDILYIALPTLKTHLSNIKVKLSLKNCKEVNSYFAGQITDDVIEAVFEKEIKRLKKNISVWKGYISITEEKINEINIIKNREYKEILNKCDL
jgi:DNA-binding CsgD family transcriptional regulator